MTHCTNPVGGTFCAQTADQAAKRYAPRLTPYNGQYWRTPLVRAPPACHSLVGALMPHIAEAIEETIVPGPACRRPPGRSDEFPVQAEEFPVSKGIGNWLQAIKLLNHRGNALPTPPQRARISLF